MIAIRLLLMLYFGVLATAFVFTVPVFMAPDEPAHLDYINFVAERGQLPYQYDPEQAVPIEGNQPPLYYLLGVGVNRLSGSNRTVRLTEEARRLAQVHRPPRPEHTFVTPADRRSFYALRVFSVGIGCANVLVILAVCGLFFEEFAYAVLAAFLAASLPQFLFLSAVVNNDTLSNL